MSKRFGTTPHAAKPTKTAAKPTKTAAKPTKTAAKPTPRTRGPRTRTELLADAAAQEAADAAQLAAEEAGAGVDTAAVLGLSAPESAADAARRMRDLEEFFTDTQIPVASPAAIGDTSSQTNNQPVANPAPGDGQTARPKEKPMTVNLVLAPKQRKSKQIVMFNIEGRRGQVQFQRSLFGESVPESLILDGDIAEPKAAKVRTPKVKLTPEERAALPKPTLAEKVQKARERADKLAAKLNAQG